MRMTSAHNKFNGILVWNSCILILHTGRGHCFQKYSSWDDCFVKYHFYIKTQQGQINSALDADAIIVFFFHQNFHTNFNNERASKVNPIRVSFLTILLNPPRFKNAKQNIITIQFLLFTMNSQFSLEVLNFSFLISCAHKEHTWARASSARIFFCIIGLCHIKIPLMKLKNFTQSFHSQRLRFSSFRLQSLCATLWRLAKFHLNEWVCHNECHRLTTEPSECQWQANTNDAKLVSSSLHGKGYEVGTARERTRASAHIHTTSNSAIDCDAYMPQHETWIALSVYPLFSFTFTFLRTKHCLSGIQCHFLHHFCSL